jgi:hypothetical protein
VLDESWDGFLGIVAKNAGRLRRAVHRGRNAVGRIALVRPQLPAHASDVDILAAAGFGVNDALAEVNAVRAKRGLRPYIRDEGLTIAAQKCANIRAAQRIAGHIDDFTMLPPGVSASATGCGALTPDWGWGTCCTTENWTYAGAACVIGNDGKRYMHLFCR